MYFSSWDTIQLHRLHEIETRSSPDSLAAARRGFGFYVADAIGSIATEQTRWRVTLTNEYTCSRSTFGSKENHPGASRAGRGFDGVADRRRCDELDLAS